MESVSETESVVRQEEEGSAEEETHSAHAADTDSFDWPADNGSVVSGVEEPPEVEEVVDVEEIRVLTVESSFEVVGRFGFE